MQAKSCAKGVLPLACRLGQVLQNALHFDLLQGTKRAQLLEAGIILEADLTLENLRKAEKVSLFNAMIDFGEREVTKIFLPDQN